MGSKPTIVVIGGAWHKPSVYSKVRSKLEKEYGYTTVGLQLHSVGAEPADTSFDNDVAVIRGALTKLVEEGKEVVFVCHSYSGMPSTEAPIGLGKKEREAKGLEGGIIRMVYVMAFAMAEGFCPSASGQELPKWMHVDLEKGITTVTPEDIKYYFYHDITSEEEKDKLVAEMGPNHSLGVFSSTQTYAAWKHIPSTYVYCTLDRTSIGPELADFMISAARQAEPTAFDVVEKTDAGHCPMASQPEWFTGVVRRAAGEKV